MFGNRRKPGVTDTLVGAGTVFNGLMKSEADVRIEGDYHGDIESKGSIVIGEGGVAKSNITARDVTIAGTVYGDVHTFGKLVITATGQLHGNAQSAILFVQEGGVLNGGSRMDGGDKKPAGSEIGTPVGSGASAGVGLAEKKAKQAG
ncbi:bactofilin family protein [Cohnella phaseoli]|uniref:Cytoskeletal protein CcmA (Bactofilin family) n=1 Tax=Cohnella phaseoli TaxID=456490 RepID=A0A3D9KFC8_9BACL|nr:polymer-forming cytoskeletal protein [Cohnella phaseoli]RED85053.1 cytoskeletal protein CcmA (bactofilin family) [Cohnella phaseoli]